MSDVQRGFTGGDECSDCNVCLEALKGSARADKKSLFIAWLGFSNAFGSVSHDLLLEI